MRLAPVESWAYRMRPPLRLAPHLVGCLTLGAGGFAASHFWRVEQAAKDLPASDRQSDRHFANPHRPPESAPAFAIDLPTHDAPAWNIQAGLDAWQAEARSSNLERLLKEENDAQWNMPSDCPLTEQLLSPPRPWLDSQTSSSVQPINDPSAMVSIGSGGDRARPLPPLPALPGAPPSRSPGQLVQTQVPQPLTPPPGGPLLRPGQGLIYPPPPSSTPSSTPSSIPAADSQPRSGLAPQSQVANKSGYGSGAGAGEQAPPRHSEPAADHIIRQPAG